MTGIPQPYPFANLRNAPLSRVLDELISTANLRESDRTAIVRNASALVSQIREKSHPGLMEVFLAEYGLSTDEGIALMCLAEALLRVPDAETIDALIEDKIAPSDWGRHLGHSASSLVNASTWALMLTGKVLDDRKPGLGGILRGAVKRVGEPVIRTAVGRAMKEMGRQFVLGETIQSAMTRADKMQAKGYTYSYDMLGEAARTQADADHYDRAYHAAIRAIAGHATKGSVAANPGISVKLSALHPRYEDAQHARVMAELAPRLLKLAQAAKTAGIGLNIDAEEADRLEISLDLIAAVLPDPSLAGWDGFGIVVQAYGQRAGGVIDWLHALAAQHDRRIMIRLVKGAYWDTEVKRAQVEGVDGFPVLTQKAATDVSYIANARRLLSKTDRIYPQFATHNAHTVSAVLHMAQHMNISAQAYEFQRLHGMGEALHDIVLTSQNTRCRIYAPVGAHKDLLAYLVRRLLENGANSSFVNQIVNEDVPPEVVAACPFEAVDPTPTVRTAPNLFAPHRGNSRGFDLGDRAVVQMIEAARAPFAAPYRWDFGMGVTVVNPARPDDTVGSVAELADAGAAFATARPWSADAATRATILRRAADMLQDRFGEVFALLAREAGKTLPDAVGELREAVDFLLYYAAEAERLAPTARGTWVCISPWNFPLAIFLGQVSAALAAGSAVIAKPAPQTPLIASLAVKILHEAGVPPSALTLACGGPAVGAALTSDPRVAGVAFTGSTATAMKIRAAMAANCEPGTPLIAETGGLNAMIVDSTALPEQAVRDIVASAFRSAGQRCSALRCLYVQSDVADHVLTMLKGAMDELRVGDPWDIATDVGPLIDSAAHGSIGNYVAGWKGESLHTLTAPKKGHFLAPTVLKVGSIKDLDHEVFGPVLHVAIFDPEHLDDLISDINAKGYGLTFGLHTRIDDRVQQIVDSVHAGNIYVNRNQIGAVVGSQPFGGEGLSGTGPKAGGPLYLPRFGTAASGGKLGDWTGADNLPRLREALKIAWTDTEVAAEILPGPTGESNRLRLVPRGPVLCLGPTAAGVAAQVQAVRAMGGIAVAAEGRVEAEWLTSLDGFATVLWWGDDTVARGYDAALAQRIGPIIALVTSRPDAAHVLHERHVCIDTTAAGGNAALLAEVAKA